MYTECCTQGRVANISCNHYSKSKPDQTNAVQYVKAKGSMQISLADSQGNDE